MSNEIENNGSTDPLLAEQIPVTTASENFVVAGFLVKDGKVLLARRAITKAIAPGLLHLPGGHVESGESLRIALVREFQEELKLPIQVGTLVHAFNYVRETVTTKGFVFVVRASLLPEVLHFDPIDNSELLWASPLELDQLFDKSDHNYVAAKKAFSAISRV
jgi:8-oxo-dGTP pyrophosphatase MutT (NUDIX family)